MSFKDYLAIRQQTGVSLVDAKFAFAEAGGDVSVAVARLQSQGHQPSPPPSEDVTDDVAPAEASGAEVASTASAELASPADDEPLLLAMRAGDEALFASSLAGREEVSASVVLAALTLRPARWGITVLSALLAKRVTGLAAEGHRLARRLSNEVALDELVSQRPDLYGAWVGRIARGIPPGLARRDGLERCLGRLHGARAARYIEGALVRSSGHTHVIAFESFVLRLDDRNADAPKLQLTEVADPDAAQAALAAAKRPSKRKPARSTPKAGDAAVWNAVAAPLRRELQRLGVIPADRIEGVNLGGVALPPSLSFLVSCGWPEEQSWLIDDLVRGDFRAFGGFAFEFGDPSLARGNSVPLVIVSYSELSQYYYVIRATDAARDPTVYGVDHDGSDALASGRSLSSLLARVRADE